MYDTAVVAAVAVARHLSEKEEEEEAGPAAEEEEETEEEEEQEEEEEEEEGLMASGELITEVDHEGDRLQLHMSDSRTGYRGVHQITAGTYEARARRGSERHSLGTFDTPLEAAIAYAEFELRSPSAERRPV